MAGSWWSKNIDTPVANNLPHVGRIGYRRVKVRWVTPLGEETASMS